MRVISGSCGGIPLQVPKNVTRPTMERIRGALFNKLSEVVADAVVLDLFAGSGAYGIESLSRGAARATFVEADRGAVEVIKSNLIKTRLAKQSEVLPLRVENALGKLPAATYSLVFADPPFKKQTTDLDHLAELLANEAFPRILLPRAVLVLERFAKTPQPTLEGPWELLEDKSYGDCAVALVRFVGS
jgi:16S rRNA (guanine966-N2)-methyltransferase